MYVFLKTKIFFTGRLSQTPSATFQGTENLRLFAIFQSLACLQKKLQVSTANTYDFLPLTLTFDLKKVKHHQNIGYTYLTKLRNNYPNYEGQKA